MTFYDQLRDAARENKLFALYQRTIVLYGTLPRWRIIPRLHGERQLRLIEMCCYCHFCGMVQAAEELAPHRVVKP